MINLLLGGAFFAGVLSMFLEGKFSLWGLAFPVVVSALAIAFWRWPETRAILAGMAFGAWFLLMVFVLFINFAFPDERRAILGDKLIYWQVLAALLGTALGWWLKRSRRRRLDAPARTRAGRS
jgi:hypothetical protein